MTSVLTSMFHSASTQLANRIEAFRATEAAILSYAKRFHYKTQNESTNQTEDTHTITVFDTKIPKSLIPFDDEASCPLKSILSLSSHENDDSLIMHAFRVESKLNKDHHSAPLVLLHGYANSSLNFYRNVFGLANHFPSVYSVDLLGWGLSSRPPLPNKPQKGKDEVQTTESFFVESFEAWRKANNLDKIILGGHSMGGYLGVAYAEAYPQHVERLILISPVGVPQEEDVSQKIKTLPWKSRLVIGIFQSFWKHGATPSSVLRRVHEERGKKITGSYVQGRLVYITHQDEKDSLRDYLYYNNALPSSGDGCLHKLLKPMAFAKKPAVDRIHHLKVKHVSFLYGEHDWMDYRGGLTVKQKCDLLSLEGNHPVPEISVYGIRDAGHMLIMDNWEEFNSAVLMAAGLESKVPLHAPKPHVSKDMNESFFRGSKFERSVADPATKKTAQSDFAADAS